MESDREIQWNPLKGYIPLKNKDSFATCTCMSEMSYRTSFKRTLLPGTQWEGGLNKEQWIITVEPLLRDTAD